MTGPTTRTLPRAVPEDGRRPVPAPALVLASHGTSDADGRAAVAALVAAVVAHRPGAPVHAGFVDVEQPDVPTLLGDVAHAAAQRGGTAAAAVVPLLLSAGYHVHHDLAEAVDEAAAAGTTAVVSAALGPDPAITDLLVQRLREAGWVPGDAVVLGAAGSSDARAVADCHRMGADLAAALGAEVVVGFLAAQQPTVREAVAQVRAAHPGARVVVAHLLLAPGYFAGLMRRSRADVVAEPLLAADGPVPPGLVDLVWRRYDATAALLPDVAAGRCGDARACGAAGGCVAAPGCTAPGRTARPPARGPDGVRRVRAGSC